MALTNGFWLLKEAAVCRNVAPAGFARACPTIGGVHEGREGFNYSGTMGLQRTYEDSITQDLPGIGVDGGLAKSVLATVERMLPLRSTAQSTTTLTACRLRFSVNARRRRRSIRHLSALRSYCGCPLVRRRLRFRVFDRLYLGIGWLLRPRRRRAAFDL